MASKPKIMKLTKIKNFDGTGRIDFGQNEILIYRWIEGASPDIYSYDNSKTIKKVNEDYFGKVVIGANYKNIEKKLPGKIHQYCTTKSKNGDVYFCTDQNDIIFGFNKDGILIFEWDLKLTHGHPINYIQFHEPDFLWIAFPTGQTITQFNLTHRTEIFKIGKYSHDDDFELLNYPESIFITEKVLFIPNIGNNRVYKVNLETKIIELMYTFTEPIWQYAQTNNGTFVVLDSGIYELEN